MPSSGIFQAPPRPLFRADTNRRSGKGRHDRPRGAEEGIGDTETNEADVDDDEEKGGHGDTSRLEWFHCTIFLGSVQESRTLFTFFRLSAQNRLDELTGLW